MSKFSKANRCLAQSRSEDISVNLIVWNDLHTPPEAERIALKWSQLQLESAFPFIRLVVSLKFIYFEREREREREEEGQRERERERERIPSSLHVVSREPDSGLEPMNHEIMT